MRLTVLRCTSGADVLSSSYCALKDQECVYPAEPIKRGPKVSERRTPTLGAELILTVSCRREPSTASEARTTHLLHRCDPRHQHCAPSRARADLLLRSGQSQRRGLLPPLSCPRPITQRPAPHSLPTPLASRLSRPQITFGTNFHLPQPTTFSRHSSHQLLSSSSRTLTASPPKFPST